MKVLISNDDGIFSPGIYALAQAVQKVADKVIIVAPDVEQSAMGHAITVRRPLRYKRTRVRGLEEIEAYRVDGTPADCVVLGVHNNGRPDIVISGINLGSNLGYDVTHSGTVGAAIEGTTMGIPSIAFSLRTSEASGELDFSHAAAYAAQLVPAIAKRGLPEKTLLNVNFPSGPIKGARLARQSTHTYQDSVVMREDPDGTPYYWVAGTPTAEREPDTDYTTVVEGYVAITPLYLDFTYTRFFADLAEVVPGLEPS